MVISGARLPAGAGDAVRNWGLCLRRAIACSLLVVLAVPFGEAAAAQEPLPSQRAEVSLPAAPEPSPGAVTQADPAPQAPASGTPQATPSTAPSSSQQSPSQGSTSQGSTSQGSTSTAPQQPVGTAVAPYEKGIGSAASRPAGAAIAPAKQRRTRSFLIKVGVILAAAAAVGTVVGLSEASPSKPH